MNWNIKTGLAAGLLVLSGAAQALNGTWTNSVSSTNWGWGTAGNWAGGTIATGSTYTADFSTVNITNNMGVQLSSAMTVGNLIFGDTDTNTAAGWTLGYGSSSTRTLTLAGGTPAITVNALGAGTNVIINVQLLGTEGLVKDGPGTLTFTTNSGYTGTTLIKAGTLEYAHVKNAAPATTNIIVANGATLLSGGTNTNLGLPPGCLLTVQNGGTLQLDKGITTKYGKLDTGASVTGAGNLYFFSPDTETMKTLTIGSISSVNTSIQFRPDGLTNPVQTLVFDGADNGPGASITKFMVAPLGAPATKTVGTNTCVMDIGDSPAAANDITVGVLSMTKGTNTDSLAQILVKQGAGTMMVAGNVAGANNRLNVTAGTLIFGGTANVFTNITVSGSGTLQFGNSGAAGSTTSAIANYGALIFNRTGSLSYGNVISGTGSVKISGGGTVTFSGTNTYSGGTTVQNGILSASADGALGSSNVVVESAWLTLGGGTRHDYIHDTARLIMRGAKSGLYLGFAGTDTVSAVSLDGGTSWLTAGVYDATALDTMGNGLYYGTGHLNVTNTPGPAATVQPAVSGIWDMTALRTNPVVMTTNSTLTESGYIRNEVYFYVTNSAGTVDRFYACLSRPDTAGQFPLVFILHGGGGHANHDFVKYVLGSTIPAGQEVVSVAIDWGPYPTDHPELDTAYGSPYPVTYSSSADINGEVLYRDMMGFRRILDHMQTQSYVNTNKTAVYGHSWGGLHAVLWAGLDNRLTVVANPVGAGGMRDSASDIGRWVAAMPEPMRERWYSEIDPLSHAEQIAARVYLSVPANDYWFWPGGVQDNFTAIPSDKRWLILPNSNHELDAQNSYTSTLSIQFIRNTLFGGPAWPSPAAEPVNSSGLTYTWQTTGGGIAESSLYFSPGPVASAGGPDWPSRYWTKIPAVLNNGTWSAALPDQFLDVAGEAFVSITGTNGFKASSLIQTRSGRNPLTDRCTLWRGENIWDIDAQENSWRQIDMIYASIAKGTASGSVKITPAADGNFNVCNSSVIMAAPYAAARQGIKLTLNGNGTAGAADIKLFRKTAVPSGTNLLAAEIFCAANIAFGTTNTEVILPWGAFVQQGTVTSTNPYPFDGLALSGTLTGGSSTSLTIQSIGFYEQQTANGIPYSWLLDHGFSGDMEAAALTDSDADGLQAWQEYIAGCDPTNQQSTFRTSVFCPPSAGKVISWNAVSGRVYSVYWTSDLTNSFQYLGTDIPWTAGSFTDSTHQAASKGFYRIFTRLAP